MSEDTAQRIADALERIADALEARNAWRTPNPKKRLPRTDGPAENTIDAWLDWRETRRAQGQRVTLEQVAERSGISINVLKKASAGRRVR